jgi:hypothetical protein
MDRDVLLFDLQRIMADCGRLMRYLQFGIELIVSNNLSYPMP